MAPFRSPNTMQEPPPNSRWGHREGALEMMDGSDKLLGGTIWRCVEGTQDRQSVRASGAKTGGFNQANLVATGRELSALIALNDHTTA